MDKHLASIGGLSRRCDHSQHAKQADAVPYVGWSEDGFFLLVFLQGISMRSIPINTEVLVYLSTLQAHSEEPVESLAPRLVQGC